MERVKRITELMSQRATIDSELKTLKEQVAAETAALKKPRQARKKKQGDLALVKA
jgi:hypothetical protein